MFRAVVLLINIVIHIITYPIDVLNHYIGSAIKYFEVGYKKPTEKQLRAHMISTVIDGILSNKDSALGERAVKRLKYIAIILLELVSFITTTIGLTIIASDISPAVAIIWAFVIQALAGVLSTSRGRRNVIILTICLIVSISSDYVCYINAVFPYDQYLESQYVNFKTSYDLAWEKAMSKVKQYESSEETIEIAFDTVEQTLSLLETTYTEESISKLQTALNELKSNFGTTKPYIDNFIGYESVTNPLTGEFEKKNKYEQLENPEYERLKSEIKDLEEKITKVEQCRRHTVQIRKDFDSLNAEAGGNAEDKLKSLIENITVVNNDNALEQVNSIDISILQDEFATLSGKLLNIEKNINQLLSNEDIGVAAIEEYNLSEMKGSNNTYQKLCELELPDFQKIRSELESDTSSFYDKAIFWFSKIVDSDFVTNTVDLKKYIQELTNRYYEDIISATASLTNDPELYALIYENGDFENIKNEAVPLETTYKQTVYQDALSRGINYLIHPNGNEIEIYSRVIYAFLADGLVLLIGYTLKRRKTSIFRIQSYRDLTNEEPRLISEAFYNLAAHPINNNEQYSVSNLIEHLEKFIGYFEVQPYFKDKNLHKTYSLVCLSDNINELNTGYKEFVNLLVTLRYIKPISEEQYNYFVKYKMNKACKSKGLEPFKSNTDETKYCYLMTEGCALYLAEKLNDLYQHQESDQEYEKFEKENHSEK